MAQRGFFAEIQHQRRVAETERQKALREEEKRRIAAAREADRARKETERLAAQAARADAAEKKRLEKEAGEAHIASMEADAANRNAELEQKYFEIDGLLEATLYVDDFIDLDTLRSVADHPPFDPGEIGVPFPEPQVSDPPEPVYMPPPQLGLMRKIFDPNATAKAHAEEHGRHERRIAQWQSMCEKNVELRQEALVRHAHREAERQEQLKALKFDYEAECAAREAEVEEQNKSLEKLIADLGYGDVDAVHEYLGIVLSNSVYPDHFAVGYEFLFDAPTAELRLRVVMPGPEALPTVKEYKYKKSADEISETSLSQKVCKDRYSGAATQIALRSMHEIFEADRRGLIKTISLEVGAETIDPATGLETFILFIATGAERESFMEIDLRNVIPSATLEHLGATVSKNPYELVPVDATGIRRS